MEWALLVMTAVVILAVIEAGLAWRRHAGAEADYRQTHPDFSGGAK